MSFVVLFLLLELEKEQSFLKKLIQFSSSYNELIKTTEKGGFI